MSVQGARPQPRPATKRWCAGARRPSRGISTRVGCRAGNDCGTVSTSVRNKRSSARRQRSGAAGGSDAMWQRVGRGEQVRAARSEITITLMHDATRLPPEAAPLGGRRADQARVGPTPSSTTDGLRVSCSLIGSSLATADANAREAVRGSDRRARAMGAGRSGHDAGTGRMTWSSLSRTHRAATGGARAYVAEAPAAGRNWQRTSRERAESGPDRVEDGRFEGPTGRRRGRRVAARMCSVHPEHVVSAALRPTGRILQSRPARRSCPRHAPSAPGGFYATFQPTRVIEGTVSLGGALDAPASLRGGSASEQAWPSERIRAEPKVGSYFNAGAGEIDTGRCPTRW